MAPRLRVLSWLVAAGAVLPACVCSAITEVGPLSGEEVAVADGGDPPGTDASPDASVGRDAGGGRPIGPCGAGGCTMPCAPLADCGGSCVDVSSDPVHCGACDAPCGPGEPCAGGFCACADGLTDCDGDCVDPSRDADHCGACAVRCPRGTRCDHGACECPSGVLCDGACVNTRDDPRHCGGCRRACGEGQDCSHGECEGGDPES